EFSMTDLGSLDYFLGVSITRYSSGMFLSHRKYATEILSRAHMIGCNSNRTPVDTKSKLGDDGDPSNKFLFTCMILGSLISRLLNGSDGWCPTTRRPTFGYCVFLCNNLLSWSSKRQTTFSRYSAETEYRGVANAVAETLLSIYFFNPVQYQRTKHIEIAIHFVRDLVAAGEVRVLHVPSRYEYANIFTKSLHLASFEEFCISLSVRCPPALTAKEC
ncbi:ribonuclease H-like domain-containing protein, partial [Tanacetum coccineum]